MKNPFQNRDLNTQLKFPTLSWSSINAFVNYDKEKWYSQYVLGERQPINSAMKAGIDIGEMLATDPTFLPEVPRSEIFEQELKAVHKDILVRGHLDGFSKKNKELREYKTAQKKEKWSQAIVDSWGQITLYCYLIYVNYKIKPEDLLITLTAIPVVETGHFMVELSKAPIRTFTTKRTMLDILLFCNFMEKVHKEMVAYVEMKALK